MSGNIVVEVIYDNSPVIGANVEIYSWYDGRVASVATDISGKTEEVRVDAPDEALSLDPNYSGTVYSVYDVRVTADGFSDVMIEGVQVFAGITSILPVIMEPSSGVQRSAGERIITIPPNMLNCDCERTPEAPGRNARIFEKVFIPEYITVHLGRPDASARNVSVSYPDYIKNVASSEIYPTWPENALRANIYAQIGFSLNRVYTEWYRSRGYAFDITNSTAYDQYFVYNRNIFENISKIVDEIFTFYPRRRGQLQPLFTSYCNGTTATCGGLSQWGTVSLAESGYSPLQILRYYYGNDTEIVQAEGISGIKTSYPGKPIRKGDRGQDVRIIQRELSRISRNYPAIPQLGEPDGIFGDKTLAAVKAFQKQFNLTADAIVGRATWNKLSYIYTAVTGLAELDGEGQYPDEQPGEQPGQQPVVTVPYPGYVIKSGMRGENVRVLQQYLSDISARYSEIPKISADGIFGARTLDAVKRFQRLFGLKVDGLVGANTWNKLTSVWGQLYG